MSWLFGVVLALPTVALSVLIVVVVAMCTGPWLTAMVAGVWLLVGIILVDVGWFTPNRQSWAAIFGFRKPVDAESEILAAAWANVTCAPGVDGWPYSLWVQQSAYINATAVPTRIVAVTSGAVAALASRQLEAVLAHELGHHLLIDQRLRLLEAWCSVPARFVQRLAAAAGRLVNALGIGAILVRFVLVVIVLALLAVALAPVVGWPVALLLSALFAIEPLASAARSRREEFAADRIAVDLGYGRDLAAALRLWLRILPPPTGVVAVRARWFGSHPPIAARLRRSERGYGGEQ
ncbi:M48 family metalloprotease [Nocardia sp. CA-135953]|uniref:M48 family metalloprotease n=1 Tax=Nocardia sp. CA-135953 TaxID=3239978 RepID=UPI003D95D19E